MLLSFTGGGASASLATTSGVFEVADADQDKVIPASWPTHSDARQCIFKGSCPHLEDVAYADVDISKAMQDHEEYAYFSVTNGLLGPTTMWLVCSYDGDGQAIECWFDDERGWGVKGELTQDARELRLMPIQSSPAEYHLKVWAG